MKCPKCEYNQKYRDGMTCDSCHYRFVFNPKVDKFTDGKMMALIRKASANDTYYFTFNQLYAEQCRRELPGTCGCILGGLLLLVVAPLTAVFAGKSGLLVACGLALVGGLVGVGTLLTRRKRPAHTKKLRGFVERWKKEGLKGSADKLIEAPRLHSPPPKWPEADIYDYGVERLMIVERDILVDLMVLNGFHSENRALILSENGYPEYLVPQAIKLLNDRPDLPVFLLHDATESGVQMSSRLAHHPTLSLTGHPIVDTGLFVEDVVQLKGLRRFNAQKLDDGVPVDLLLYGTLAAGLATALIQETTLAALMAAQDHTGAGGGGDGGSFG